MRSGACLVFATCIVQATPKGSSQTLRGGERPASVISTKRPEAEVNRKQNRRPFVAPKLKEEASLADVTLITGAPPSVRGFRHGRHGRRHGGHSRNS